MARQDGEAGGRGSVHAPCGFKHFPSRPLASGAATFYTFSPSIFHQIELSPPKIEGTVTTFSKSFKDNVLRNTRTIRLSQTFPINGATVAHANLLTNMNSDLGAAAPPYRFNV
jgi:hypothetical protein